MPQFTPSPANAVNRAFMIISKALAPAALLPFVFAGALAAQGQGSGPAPEKAPPRPATLDGAGGIKQKGPRDEGPKAIKDDPFARAKWLEEWHGPVTADYLNYRMSLAEGEIQKWGPMIPGTAAHKLQERSGPGKNIVRAGIPEKTWKNIGPWRGEGQLYTPDGNISDTGRVTVILPHPDDPRILYVGYAGGGLWRCSNADLSTNADWEWESLTDGLPSGSPAGNISIGGGAFKPEDPSTIYISLGDMMPGSASGTAEGRGLFISNDGGQTWARGGSLGNTTRTKTVLALPGNIVLVAGNDGLYRSTDGGATFARMAQAPLNGAPRCWDILRLDSGTLVLSGQADGLKQAASDPNNGGIAYSTDNGATWAKAATVGFPSGTCFARIAISASGQTLYGLYQEHAKGTFPRALMKSTDGGRTWSYQAASGLYSYSSSDGEQAGYNHMVAADPAAPNTVFVGTNFSVYRSRDGGRTFEQMTDWMANRRQYTHADMHVSAWAPVGPKALYVGTDGGLSIFRQPDIDPIPASSGPMPSDPAVIDHRRNRNIATQLIYNIGSTNAATPPGSRERVIAGFQDLGTRLRTENTAGDNTYDLKLQGDGFGCLIHPYNGDLMLGSIYYSAIRRSVNGGRSFGRADVGLPENVPWYTRLFQTLADPTGDRAYTFSNTEPYVSDDFGASWSPLPTNGNGWPRLQMRSFGASPLKLGLIGATLLNQTVAISDDNGGAWRASQISGHSGNLAEIAFDTADVGIVYVTSVDFNASSHHLWKSANGGQTWAPIDGSATNSNGFPFGVPVHIVKVDPLDNNVVYAGTDLGLYRSTDQGGAWERFGYGLPMVSVRDIYIAPDGSFMRIGTHGRGVWEMEGMADYYSPKVIAHPQAARAYSGNGATFSVGAIGIPAPAYQWQASDNGGSSWQDVPGATGRTYTGTFGLSDNGKLFRALATNGLGSSASEAAALRVAAPISVSIASANAATYSMEPIALTASATGGFGGGEVAWSSAQGNVTPGGVFSALFPGDYAVTATSVEDPTKSATATVKVAQTVSVSVTPQAVNLAANSAKAFAAAIAGGMGNSGVSWAASGGAVTQAGAYTAPGEPGTYTVTATSVEDPTKSDAAIITVLGGPAVEVLPGSITLGAGGSHAFGAAVTGAGSGGVTWSANGGSITPGGLYTAPAAPGLYTVTAASVSDPSSVGAATVTVHGGGDLYIAGVGQIDGAWKWAYLKNGEMQHALADYSSNPDISDITSIFVSGSDVYVTGHTLEGGSNVGKLWKNGVAQNLPYCKNANSVFVDGGDVYVAGRNVADRACTWKNGAPHQELSYSSQARSIFVSGGSVYVAGWLVNVHPSPPILWINGAEHRLISGDNNGTARSVFVDGGNVYVAGQEFEAETSPPDFFAKLWANEFPANLSRGADDRAFSVFASGGDVYVAGQRADRTYTYRNTLWKNGAAQDIGNVGAESVFVFGDDVYVAGSNQGLSPRYWKNGSAVGLPNNFYARYVFVASGISVSVSPKVPAMMGGRAQKFKASIFGSLNAAVTWSASGGSITQDGTFTAPIVAGAYTVTATSLADPSKSDTVSISVIAPPSGIAIVSPPKGMFASQSGAFAAEMFGLDDLSVTWSASAGDINPATGQYTAPAAAQTVTITAASAQEPTLRASVEVKISTTGFDGNSKARPQLLDFANAFGSTARADLDKYDFNNDGNIDADDLLMLFEAMGWLAPD